MLTDNGIIEVKPSKLVADGDSINNICFLSPDTADVFNHLYEENKYLYTSLGENYSNATFGRDSLITARELLHIKPQVAHDVILRLAAFQGTKTHARSGEENGRIHHEHRELDTWKKEGLVKKIGQIALSLLWGGNLKQMTTYFSIDSTPLYISLVADYAEIDPSILDEKITRNDGQEITVEQSVIDATNWLEGHISKSSGLVEVGRSNSLGLVHQTWKDSPTGYEKEDGSMTNITKPMAYLNIQALASDGLSASAKLFSETDPKQSQKWQTAADSIVEETIEKFWMEDEQFFAGAIDKDQYGNEQLIKTIQSDAGWMLNTDFFDKLPDDKRKKYVSAIVTELFSSNFLTDVGIRCRSLKYADNSKVADYHGSLVSWPVDTYQIAQGLRNQGLPKLAQQLDLRILNTINKSNDHSEFYYIDRNGKVLLDAKKAMTKKPGSNIILGQMHPESDIAWTVAAAFAGKDRYKDGIKEVSNPDTDSWEFDLDTKIAANIKDVITSNKINELLDTSLDIETGNKISSKRIIKELSKLALRQYFSKSKQK